MRNVTETIYYSNSGKTKYREVKLIIDGRSKVISREEIDKPKTGVTSLNPDDFQTELNDFEEEIRLEQKNLHALMQRQSEVNKRREELHRVLDAKELQVIGNKTLKEINDKALILLGNNGDFTSYLPQEIIYVLLCIALDYPIVFDRDYNSHPVTPENISIATTWPIHKFLFMKDARVLATITVSPDDLDDINEPVRFDNLNREHLLKFNISLAPSFPL
jgi:hypothetical protein